MGRVCVVLLLGLLWPLVAQGIMPANRAELPNLDKRAEAASGARQLAVDQGKAVRQQATEQLKTRLRAVRVDEDELLGTPKFVRALDGFLTGPGGEGRAVKPETVRALAPNDPHRAAKAFLNEHKVMFGHGAEVLASARAKRDYVTPHNGMHTAVWQQELDGIAVFDGVLITHTTQRGELVNISSRFLTDPGKAADKGLANRKALQQAPKVSAEQAVAAAGKDIGETLTEQEVTRIGPAPEGSEKRQYHTAPRLLGKTEAKLVWLPMDREAMRLCWEVILTGRTHGEMFQIVVDAETGEVLVRRCLTNYISDASYNVFTSDSPSPFSPGHSTPSSTQPSVVSRQLVTLGAISINASPNGWINDGDNTTLGNNVDAHLDKDANNVADPGSRPTGSPFRVFDFSMDLAQAPVTYTNACVVQLFYWNNFIHDKLYDLGFTEAAGNFQTDNFSRGGLGNDAVQADAQDGSGSNNANFSTPPDGSAPRMQMYVFTGPTPDRDGDFDADIVLHEYTHGLSNRLVGGGVGMSALQSRGMGEGWSDFYALSLLSEATDDANGNYAAGGYATYQLSGLTENYYYGIRRYPYSTDMTKNPLTFKDIDPAQASGHSGIPRSPIINNTANEVHNMGEVWCVTLWEARARLITKYGWATGNQLILQLVTDGMKLSPANPTYLQARDAILQADQVNNGGANRNELWAAFAKRGMGFSATSPASSTTTGVVEAYDVADDLGVSPATSFASSGPLGGPFLPASADYTVSNNGAADLPWAVIKTQSWLDVASSGGTLAPGASADVTVSINAVAGTLPLGLYTDTLIFSNTVSSVTQSRSVQLRVQGYASMPFTETFETGALQPYWTTSGTATYRSQVTSASIPHAGVYHLTMDSSSDGTYARNEVTLGINLAGYKNVVLSFWVKGFSDESNGPPSSPFTSGADFDGVAISADGNTWWEVAGLRSLSSAWTKMTVDLDAAIAAHGLSFNSTFRIRFNQYDNYTISTDGIAIDDISITGTPTTPTAVTGSPLPSGTVGLAYNLTLTASGGVTPYTWSLLAGNLPSGLSLSSEGVISGTPDTVTAASFTVQVTGNDGLFSTKDFTLTIQLPPTIIDGVTVNDPGTYMVGNNSAFNALIITNGGLLTSADGVIGNSIVSSNNIAWVTGPGSLWSNGGSLYVGNTGSFNTLTLTNGGSVLATNIVVGFESSSTGNVITVSGGHLLATNADGGGALEVRYGALVFNSGTVTVDRLLLTNGANSVFNFNGGTLHSGGSVVTNGALFKVGNGISAAVLHLAGGTHSFADGLFINTNGWLTGTGAITGVITNAGAIAPGDSVGIITGSSSLTLLGNSLLQMQLAGTDAWLYDQINVAGTLNFGGTLSVSLLDGFTPHLGDRFDLFDFSSSSGAFSLFNLPTLDAQLYWDTSQLYSSGDIEVDPVPPGAVIAWGVNSFGQTNVPAGLVGVVGVAGGSGHSVVLEGDGTVAAWGDNTYQQTNLPAGLSGIVTIAAGSGHSLALRSNGTVAAWGRNDSGQANVPGGLSSVVGVAAGDVHSLVLKSNGTVVAWGNNVSGQSSVPAGLSGVVAVEAGGSHSMALKSNGTVVAWGYNVYGQTSVPAGLSDVIAIAAAS